MTNPSQPLPPTSSRSRRRGRWLLYALTALLSLSAVAETLLRQTAPMESVPSLQAASAAPQELGPVVLANPDNPLDEPLRLLARARRAYGEVRDYSCLFVKRERLGDKLGSDQVMSMQVRAEPFSVHLKWQEPRNLVGQEVCYVVNKHNGKMRGKPAGPLGAMGFHTLDPDDARARAASRHSITEAGVGNLLCRFTREWEESRHLPGTQVRLADYEYNHRHCTRVEVSQPEKKPPFTAFRTVMYFDQESHLPIRLEVYDWPQEPGGDPEILEIYSYVNLVLNPGLDDTAFNY
jgi:hypothetical protein